MSYGLALKYARIFVRGHYLIFENSEFHSDIPHFLPGQVMRFGPIYTVRLCSIRQPYDRPTT